MCLWYKKNCKYYYHPEYYRAATKAGAGESSQVFVCYGGKFKFMSVRHLGPVQQRSKNGKERDMAASMWIKCHPRNLKPHLMNWVRALTVENVSGYLSPTLLLIRSDVRVSCRTADEAPAKQQHQLVIKFCTLMLGLVSRNHTFSLINI